MSINKKVIVIIILFIVFFIILNLTNLSNNVKNFFYLISAPIQRTFWLAGSGISDFFEAIANIENLQEKNKNLELKIQEINAKIARFRDIEKQNRILRETLDIGLQKEFDIVFAQIIGIDIRQDSILINKGSENGILKDMPVITQQRILLGKISDVYKNFSKVMLISDKESIVPVNIQHQKIDDKLINIEALAKGKGNFQIKLDRIPLENEIKNQSKIVTSVLGGFFPSGILIGYIKNIERLGVELFQRAEVQPAIDVRDINDVFIIISF